MKLSSKVLAIGLTGLLAVGVAGAALADDPPRPDRGSQQDHGLRGRLVQAGVKELTEASGLDAAVFKQGLKDGKSINQVLTENNVDPATVLATVLADLDAKLDEGVDKGKISREQADNIYAKAQENLPTLMDRVPGSGERGHGIRERAAKGLLQTAAETIGVEVKTLLEQLRAGQTIAEVATANGVAPDTVIDAAVAKVEARIDQAVAEQKISAEKGEELKSKAEERITKFVNEGRPQR